MYLEIDNTDVFSFLQESASFYTPLFIFSDSSSKTPDVDGNIIAGPVQGTGTDRVLIYDTNNGQIKYRLASTFFDSLSGTFEGFETASITGGSTNILGGTTTNLQFKYRS